MIEVMCCAGKDVYWYTREKADQDANEAAELLAVKQREEDLMAEVCLRQCRPSVGLLYAIMIRMSENLWHVRPWLFNS